jgi:hypothetical protein
MPFSEHRIKYLLRDKTGLSLTALARIWKVRLEELSMCVRQVEGRIYPIIRLKVASAIGHPVNTVFGRHPLTDALLSTKHKGRKAA